jgi:hypothetical protein
MSLSNIEIMQLAKFLKVPIVSISFKDEIPVPPKYGYYIVNLQSSTQGNGTHWLAMIIDKDGCFHFDPFGAVPPLEIIDFFKLVRKDYGYNEKEIQYLNSNLCGFFCLGLLHYFHNNKKLKWEDRINGYLNIFSNIPKLNDNVLRNYFKRFKKQSIFANRLYRK